MAVRGDVGLLPESCQNACAPLGALASNAPRPPGLWEALRLVGSMCREFRDTDRAVSDTGAFYWGRVTAAAGSQRRAGAFAAQILPKGGLKWNRMPASDSL